MIIDKLRTFIHPHRSLVRIRNSHSEMFLEKSVVKICSKFTGEQPCQSAISIKLQSNFGMGILLQVCCIFSEDLFLRTPLDGFFCRIMSRMWFCDHINGWSSLGALKRVPFLEEYFRYLKFLHVHLFIISLEILYV